jgi:Aspartyl protease/PDZ domain
MIMRNLPLVITYNCVLCAALIATLALAAESDPASQLPQTGCAAWRNTSTLTVRGTSDADGLKGSVVETIDIPTGRYVTVQDYGLYSEADGFAGQFNWAKDSSGASHQLDSGPARAIAITESWLRRRGWCDGDAPHVQTEKMPDTQIGNITASVWRIIPPGGIPTFLRFGPAGLLLESEVRLWSNRQILHYSDWRNIGSGVPVPFLVRSEDPEDQSDDTITLTSADVSKHHASASVFSKPPQPRDYSMAAGAAFTTVPYEDDGVARIFVPVMIDGHGPFPFELDTGGHFILSTDTASTLGLSPVGNFTATGGGTGVAHEGLVRTHEIRIGAAILREQPAWVHPFPKAGDDRGLRAPRAGILGLELFERFAVHLDRRQKTVTLTPLESFHAPGRGFALPIRFTEDAPMTSGSYNGVAGDFELDSGNAGPAIIEGYWAEQHGLAPQLRHGVVWSGSGIGGDYESIVSRGDLSIGPLQMPHEPIVYVGVVERGSESTQMQAGNIGESSLYRFDITFDYAREQVWIDSATDTDRRPFNRSGLKLKKDVSGDFVVSLVVPSSPAAAAGLVLEDRILSVGGHPSSGLAWADASVMLSGPVGAEVTLSVISKSGGNARDVVLRLAEILP